LLFKDFYSYNIHILHRIYSFRANRYHTGITDFLLVCHIYMVLAPCNYINKEKSLFTTLRNRSPFLST